MHVHERSPPPPNCCYGTVQSYFVQEAFAITPAEALTYPVLVSHVTTTVNERLEVAAPGDFRHKALPVFPFFSASLSLLSTFTYV